MNLAETIEKLDTLDAVFARWHLAWRKTARPQQRIDFDFVECGIQAGRGFGKTRVGAEWLGKAVYMDDSGYDSAVIAPTYQDVKFTCFEGESGLMSVIPPELIHNYNKTDMVIEMHNVAGGISTIRGFTAEKPERLRGPQHTRAWCTPGETLVRMADGTDRRVDEVQVGEFVMTREGPRRVLVAGRSDNPNAQVRISYGASRLTATEDHPIFTNRGWVPAGEVREGDLLCAIGASNGAVSVGTLTTVGTTSELTSLFAPSARSGCTGPYGNITTGLYPQGTTFTTPITTSTTTTQPTFISWLEGYIAATITSVVKPLKASALRLQASCIAFGHVLSIARRRVPSADRLSVPALFLASPGAFAAPSALSVGGWEHRVRPNGPVTCAGRVTLRSGEPVGSVPPPAERSIGSRTRQAATLALASIASSLSSRSGPACDSAQKPALTKLAVEGVERLSTRVPVYCLKVEGEPEYFANGILVHNCDELAAWQYDETWDMMQMGLRLGDKPQVLWTTTPKPRELVRKLVAPKEGRVIITGSTYDNRANLPDSFFEQLAQYEGTRIGRQELYGELIDPEETGIVKRSDFRLWPSDRPLPRFDLVIMSLDTAFTERTFDKRSGDPDPTACTVWGVFDHEKRANIILLDCWEEHLGMPDLIRRVRKEMKVPYGEDADKALIKPLFGSAKPSTSGRKPDILLIEDKGSGISLRQMLDQEGIMSHPYNPGNADKLTRLHIVSPIFARKMVWLPESEKYKGRPKSWIEPMVQQICAYNGPGSTKHDDYVDSTTQALRLCMDKGWLDARKVKEEFKEPERAVANPYAV